MSLSTFLLGFLRNVLLSCSSESHLVSLSSHTFRIQILFGYYVPYYALFSEQTFNSLGFISQSYEGLSYLFQIFPYLRF